MDTLYFHDLLDDEFMNDFDFKQNYLITVID